MKTLMMPASLPGRPPPGKRLFTCLQSACPCIVGVLELPLTPNQTHQAHSGTGHLENTATALRLLCAQCRTLPSNLALCVNPGFDYVRARDPATGKVYIVAESRLASIPGAVPKAKKGARGTNNNDAEPQGWQVSASPLSLPCSNTLASLLADTA